MYANIFQLTLYNSYNMTDDDNRYLTLLHHSFKRVFYGNEKGTGIYKQ